MNYKILSRLLEGGTITVTDSKSFVFKNVVFSEFYDFGNEMGITFRGEDGECVSLDLQVAEDLYRTGEAEKDGTKFTFKSRSFFSMYNLAAMTDLRREMENEDEENDAFFRKAFIDVAAEFCRRFPESGNWFLFNMESDHIVKAFKPSGNGEKGTYREGRVTGFGFHYSRFNDVAIYDEKSGIIPVYCLEFDGNTCIPLSSARMIPWKRLLGVAIENLESPHFGRNGIKTITFPGLMPTRVREVRIDTGDGLKRGLIAPESFMNNFLNLEELSVVKQTEKIPSNIFAFVDDGMMSRPLPEIVKSLWKDGTLSFDSDDFIPIAPWMFLFPFVYSYVVGEELAYPVEVGRTTSYMVNSSFLDAIGVKYQSDDKYTVVCWPDSQALMDVPGFREMSFLVNDERGLEKYGSSAYFVKKGWLDSAMSSKENTR